MKLILYRNHYTSVTACVKDTYARDGVRAFWRGESGRRTEAIAYKSSFTVFFELPSCQYGYRNDTRKSDRVTRLISSLFIRFGTRADVPFFIAVWIPTLTITASRTTSFTIYQKAKYSFSAAIGRATGGAEPLVTVNKPGSTPTPATIVCFAAAGCTAGSLTGLFSCMFRASAEYEEILTLDRSI